MARDIEKLKKRQHEWYLAHRNPERQKAYSEANKEHITKSRQAWAIKNREKIAAKARERYLRNREKILARKREQYAVDPKKARIYQKSRRDADPEHFREKSRQAHAKHAIERRERSRKWRQEHPATVTRYYHERRARVHNARGQFTEEQLRAREAFFGNCCAYCGGTKECNDHAIALAKGGTNWPANLRPACFLCNRKKNAQDWRRWMPLI